MQERRIGARAQVDLPVLALRDGFIHECRAVDISTTGMVVQQSQCLSKRSRSLLHTLEVELRGEPILIRARTVWRNGRLNAVRFVSMRDVDRLTIAEDLDRRARLRERLH